MAAIEPTQPGMLMSEDGASEPKPPLTVHELAVAVRADRVYAVSLDKDGRHMERRATAEPTCEGCVACGCRRESARL